MTGSPGRRSADTAPAEAQEFIRRGRALAAEECEALLLLGDLINHDFSGRNARDPEFKEFAAAIGMTPAVLARYTEVAAFFPPKSRRPEMSFSWHEKLMVLLKQAGERTSGPAR
ncbi:MULTISPECIES: hypothetical protein [Streptomyces]|uniref:Uncharacterized protein n=1 Tax=Streptomyces venezuelae TaxID=54571 RepID=A0A5P2ATE3_STRVZ|nr:hypothetical protein [Streptomyces venezuelae]QES21296.1 hypothetical protein DEJ46_21105 [Streptomyces venezuelae]